MSGAASRERGARAERAVVNYLIGRGFAGARRHSGADGRAPGDIFGIPGVCIEVKDRASSAWPSWRAQLLAECPPGDIPVLVRRVRGVTDVGQWDAEMLCDDLARLYGLWPRYTYVGSWCPRTRRNWVRVPFRTITDLLNPSSTATPSPSN